jgi:hypothetical protein
MTRLLSSTEAQDAIGQLQDGWGINWRDDPLKRLALNTLHKAEGALRTFEDAALQRKAANFAAAIFCPPAVDEDGMDDRARRAGVGA